MTDPGNDLVGTEFRDELTLTDGGVYDNLGIETAWKQYRTILVSDGGGHLVPDPIRRTTGLSRWFASLRLLTTRFVHCASAKSLQPFNRLLEADHRDGIIRRHPQRCRRLPARGRHACRSQNYR